jgi:hypothetical protein
MGVAHKQTGMTLSIGAMLARLTSPPSRTFGESVQRVDIADLFAAAQRACWSCAQDEDC